ncbi:MAG: dTDP-4-amino-4,6-dideoxygalactose transaminase [Desulfatibacillaceae bacterium]|nr:dTDP-4-amino-4,6-dideoxygalactose transaminase [Desulfatibacillaceae bacterium]
MEKGSFIPFHRPWFSGKELAHVADAVNSGRLMGAGPYAGRCEKMLEAALGCKRVLCTNSATAALEMAGLLLGIGPGDEVIVPSFAFVSTANAFALLGATPVFADIRPDTFNLDEEKLEQAITKKTKAIAPVHYAGVGCNMEAISAFGLPVIEDAALGLFAALNGRPLGTIGDFGVFSFHQTKGLTCGEGGALAVNRADIVGRAETVLHFGTDRAQYLAKKQDSYSWCEKGSSFSPSELCTAFLLGQLESVDFILESRKALWQGYHLALEDAEKKGLARRPVIPEGAVHNACQYWLLMADAKKRDLFIEGMNRAGVQAASHYPPLHQTPAGKRLGRSVGHLSISEDIAGRIARLPFWTGMDKSAADKVIDTTLKILARL